MPLKSFSQADMVLGERRRLERPLLAMVWLGTAALAIIEGSGVYIMATTVAVGANFLALRRHREIHVRRLYVNIAVLLASLSLLVEVVFSEKDMKLSLGHYLVLIQLCKLFEHKANRDYVQIFILSALVMVVGVLLSHELWFALTLVTYLALTCYAGCVFTLKRGLDAEAASLADEAAPPATPHATRNVARHWPRGALRRYTALSAGAMLFVGAALFILAPRGDLSAGRADYAQSSGMAAAPTLGQAKKIYLSDRVVMTIDHTGPDVSAYMRGSVFYSYITHANSRRGSSSWIPALPKRLWLDNRPVDVSHAVAVQEVTMVVDYLPLLFVTPPAAHVEFVEARTSDHAIPHDRYTTAVRDDGTFKLQLSSTFVREAAAIQKVVYRIHVLPEDSPRRADMRKDYKKALARVFDDMTGPTPATRGVGQLAEAWCADILADIPEGAPLDEETTLRIANRITRRLREDYTYTLDLTGASKTRDGVEDFLFHLKKGHCEYFASALTVMCRHLKVPARLATGFHTDGGRVVRERNAHAWSEVYLPSRGWVIFDATPADNRGTGQQDVGWLEGIWQGAKEMWREHFIDYDLDTRAAIGQAIRNAISAAGQALTHGYTAVKNSLTDMLLSGYGSVLILRLALGICALGLTVAGVLLVREGRKRRKWRRLITSGRAVPWNQFDFVRALVDLFIRHGQGWHHDVTLRQWARHAAATLNLPHADVNELVELYYRLRWGHIPANDDELAQARALVNRFAHQLDAPAKATA